MSNIFIRRIEKQDFNDILLWRNNLISREMSKETNIIKVQEHEKWFNNIINDNKQIPIICIDLSKSIKIAFVNFKLNNIEKSSLISININPLHRNKGYSSLCLLQSIDFLKKEFVKCENIIAEIKDINLPSIKLFKKIGFKKKNSSNEGVASYKFIIKK